MELFGLCQYLRQENTHPHPHTPTYKEIFTGNHYNVCIYTTIKYIQTQTTFVISKTFASTEQRDQCFQLQRL